MNTKPHFICVGAPKAGTTALHDVLCKHSQLYLPQSKEIHFFDNHENFEKGKNWYFDHYKNASQEMMQGEITPAYMCYDYTPKRIFDTLGKNVRLVFVLRQPVKRAWSEYQHNSRRTYVDYPDFKSGIDADLNSLDKEAYSKRLYSYITRGHYAKQILKFLEFFDKSQMLFLCFETDLVQNPKATYDKIQDFLGLDREDLNVNHKTNEAFVPKNMALQKLVFGPSGIKKLMRNLVPGVKVRRKVRELIMKFNSSTNATKEKIDSIFAQELFKKHYQEDISDLEDLTGLNLEHWRKDETCG